MSSGFDYTFGLAGVLARIEKYRERLNLPQPGTIETASREARGVIGSHLFFDGGRADLAKLLSPNFQVTHTFQLAQAGTQAPSMYNFAAVFATEQTLLHGTVDNEGLLQGRCNHQWTKQFTTKSQIQIHEKPGMSMLQLEADYLGKDFSLNGKAINPSPIDGTGIYTLSALQSVTKNLALGVEAVFQRPTPDMEESQMSLVGKYTFNDILPMPMPLPQLPQQFMAQSPAEPHIQPMAVSHAGMGGAEPAYDDLQHTAPHAAAAANPAVSGIPPHIKLSPSTLTFQLQGLGMMQAEYFHRVNERVEFAATLDIMPSQETGKPEAVCSVGGKYDLRGATIRSSFDTRGKVRMMMEEKVYPGILLSLNGEIDHVKSINRFGIGLSMEG